MAKRGAGEGSIYEERPGKWVASVTAGYAFRDGKRVRIRKKFSAPTRKGVADKLTTALRSQQIGVSVAPNKRTVGWFLNYWLDQVVTPGANKPKTVTFYRYITETHLLPAIGDVLLDKLTGVHVQAMLNDKRNSRPEWTAGRLARIDETLASLKARKPREGDALKIESDRRNLESERAELLTKTLSSRTVAGIRRTLRTALEVALGYEFVYRNVAASRGKKGQSAPVTKSEAKFLQLAEARALLAAAGSEPLYYALFATILSLGLRLGEALALRLDDVDLATGRLYVRHTLQRVDGRMLRLELKTAHSKRTINLPAVTIAALSEHADRQRQAKEWGGTRWKGNSWNLIFTSSIGTPLDERSVLRIFQDKILKRAGLPKMRIHDLRHSAAAILIAQGVDARSISELLGHSSVAFTLQTYGHLLESTKRETAEKMNAALAPENPVAPSLTPLSTSAKPN
jgi:integrase